MGHLYYSPSPTRRSDRSLNKRGRKDYKNQTQLVATAKYSFLDMAAPLHKHTDMVAVIVCADLNKRKPGKLPDQMCEGLLNSILAEQLFNTGSFLGMFSSVTAGPGSLARPHYINGSVPIQIHRALSGLSEFQKRIIKSLEVWKPDR